MVERCFRMAQVAVRFRLAPFGNRLWKFVEARSCKKQHQRSFFGGRSMSNELIHNPRQFDEIIHIIENARRRALKAVNAELIQMYWKIGEYLSELCAASSFGDKVIDEVANYIAKESPPHQRIQSPGTLSHEAILRNLQE